MTFNDDMKRKKLVNTATVADYLSGGNLCSLSPYLINALAVLPGDLVIFSLYEDFSGKKIAARVAPVRLETGPDELKIAAEAEVWNFLDIRPGDRVFAASGYEMPACTCVTFEAHRMPADQSPPQENQKAIFAKFTSKERQACRKMILHARWAVFPGATFCINIDGEPLTFYVNPMGNTGLDCGIIDYGTQITIFDAEDREIFEKENQLRIANATLLELDNDIMNLENIIKSNSEELTRVKEQIDILEKEEMFLEKQRTMLQNELENFMDGPLKDKEEELKTVRDRLAEAEEKYQDAEANLDHEGFDMERMEQDIKNIEESLHEVFEEL